MYIDESVASICGKILHAPRDFDFCIIRDTNRGYPIFPCLIQSSASDQWKDMMHNKM